MAPRRRPATAPSTPAIDDVHVRSDPVYVVKAQLFRVLGHPVRIRILARRRSSPSWGSRRCEPRTELPRVGGHEACGHAACACRAQERQLVHDRRWCSRVVRWLSGRTRRLGCHRSRRRHAELRGRDRVRLEEPHAYIPAVCSAVRRRPHWRIAAHRRASGRSGWCSGSPRSQVVSSGPDMGGATK
jgi:hypothetical protein